MLALIVGLHFVLGSIWLINNDHLSYGILSFIVGMVATHYGWKTVVSKKQDNGSTQD